MTSTKQPVRTSAHPPRPFRSRLIAGCLAALMLGAVLLGGGRSMEREEAAIWTEATWSDADRADSAFTALTLGGIQNYQCSAGLWAAATVTWQRPAGTPSGVVSYRVTMQRGSTTQTTTQTGTSYEYSRPFGNFTDVTITVQPVIGQWTGPSRSMTLEAVVAVGMRCP